MNEFIPSAANQNSRTPELQEKIASKRRELQSLKKELKTTVSTKKKEIQAKIKSLIKELKMISPKHETW